jgi:peptidyl-prolyl cis-trans isomerase SurA
MKKIFLAVLFLTVLQSTYSQPLFTYGKKQVSKKEFEKAFNKNPLQEGQNRKTAIKEYLNLYIHFKLKVEAALADSLDKDQQYKYEVANFRRQLADNFVNEEAKIKDLQKEAFERAQKDILVKQVVIEFTGTDTGLAYKKIQEAYKALQAGDNFELVSKKFSTDLTIINLGYITVFSLGYNFENKIYSLQPGKYSTPFKSSFAYHIFYNQQERAALGTRLVAHILFAFPPNATDTEKANKKILADSVYQLLLKGASFTELVKTYSNDNSTLYSDGQLPEFGIGTYSADFEEAAFALKERADISKPVLTQYGYHIIRLNEPKPVPKVLDDDPEYAGKLKIKLEQDKRLEKAKQTLINKWLKKTGFKAATFDTTALFSFVDSFIVNNSYHTNAKIKANTLLFSYSKQKVTAIDFAQFARAAKAGKVDFNGDMIKLLNRYKEATCTEYYRDHLAEYNEDYQYQAKEFEEANLLFAAMDKYVWGKAAADEEGLQAYYNANKKNYQWAASANALIVNVNDAKLVEEVQQKLEANPTNWRSITEAYANRLSADSNRFELGQIPVAERTRFSDGLITSTVNNADGSVTFAYIFKVMMQPQQRSFEEARGLIVNDYQQVLEQQWLNILKKKYPVVVHQAVVNSLL